MTNYEKLMQIMPKGTLAHLLVEKGQLADSHNSTKQYYKCTVLYYFYVDRTKITCYNKRRC